jgi:hypothetical protein
MTYDPEIATKPADRVALVLPGASNAEQFIRELTRSQLEHALDAHVRGLKVYESLQSLNEVIGTQYGDRVLFELLQNAHDAHGAHERGEVSIRLLVHGPGTGELLVANRGRPFTRSNLDALRNIGTSDKKIGEGIGNKGLGFRSVEALTDDARIFSAGADAPAAQFGGFCFRFASVHEISTGLLQIGADAETAETVAQVVPRYLVPIPLHGQSEEVRRLSQEGYATVVCLPLMSKGAVDLARRQVAAILESTVPVQLFLERLHSLEVAVVEADGKREDKRLERRVDPIWSAEGGRMRLERVTLSDGNELLLARSTLDKDRVLKAVRDSIAAAPALKRWLDWRGEAVVSVGVGLGKSPVHAPRLFNFLPLDEQAQSPFLGHVDAPFFADIDRRSIKPDLPLNRYLLEAVAETCAKAVLAIVDEGLDIPPTAAVDLAAWSGPHLPKIVTAFGALKRPLGKAAVWPTVRGGGRTWASFETLYAWPEVRTRQLTPARIVSAADADILADSLGEARLGKVAGLACAVNLPLDPGGEVLCRWTEAAAADLLSKGLRYPGRWREFYDDVVALFAARGEALRQLVGRRFLLGADDTLVVATATGSEGAPPVFHRAGTPGRGGADRLPRPPSALSRKFRFLNARVEISEATFRALEKAGLLRRYDPIEALQSLKGALGANATETQRREALLWAFRVWRRAGGKATEEALGEAELHVPCVGGWAPARAALMSGSWSALGRVLERYLHEAAGASEDCRTRRRALLAGFSEWPRSASDDKREDWLRFLFLIGAKDGLQPIAGQMRRKSTPSAYWNYLFLTGDAKLGLDDRWTERSRGTSLKGPQTEYRLDGEVWRLPGQLEHASLPQGAREALSDLIVAYLREHGDAHFTFRISHWRGRAYESLELPTPVQIFLRHGEWPASVLGDEIVFAAPAASWSSTSARLIPPRFVARFGAEQGRGSGLPEIMFEPRIGLQDWSRPSSAPERLDTLAGSLADLSAAERRDLRDQLRRAWGEIAEARAPLSPATRLVVDRAGGLDLCLPDAAFPPIVYVTGERQGFAARALADAGEAVLDVGDADVAAVGNVLSATGAYAVRLADSGDVQLDIDGAKFEPSAEDPLLVVGGLSWLGDVAALAHEFLGDSLELRTLPVAELDRRIRLIRVRWCDSFDLTVGGRILSFEGEERAHAVPHPRLPTLLLKGGGTLDIDLLLEASAPLTKLVGSRRNTLEIMLGRLQREGFRGGAATPAEDMLARAIRRDVGVIRDHFAATLGGVERRVMAVLPVVAYLAGREAADRLAAQHGRLGPALRLRDWMMAELGETAAENALAAIDDNDDQRRLGFDFVAYGRTLAELGYPPLNEEAEFRRLFSVFLAEIGPSLRDRLRAAYADVWRAGGDLSEYVALRDLSFIPFDPAWPLEREDIDLSFVSSYAHTVLEARIRVSDASVPLPPFEAVAAGNRKLLGARYARLASVVRAWCRTHDVIQPALMASADPLPLVRALDEAGLLDFEALKAGNLPALISRVGGWPEQMPQGDDLGDLGLTDADLEHEEREAREARLKADAARRTIQFGDRRLDTGAEDFATIFADLAEAAVAADRGWVGRSRPPRLAHQEQGERRRKAPGANKGTGTDWQNQPPEKVRQAMGIASEWLAREYLRLRHPKEMTDECWKSSNRALFCVGPLGDDSLGYDFRVETARHEYLYEVKSAIDEGGDFELTARELEVAGSASADKKRCYRILYVPFVFDPTRWRVLPLANPVGIATRDRYRVVRAGSVRYRFERK